MALTRVTGVEWYSFRQLRAGGSFSFSLHLLRMLFIILSLQTLSLSVSTLASVLQKIGSSPPASAMFHAIDAVRLPLVLALRIDDGLAPIFFDNSTSFIS